MKFVRKPRKPPIINIISLIDILVVLLIFYIATTVFKKAEPKVLIKVPDSTQAKSTPDKRPSILFVTADGKMYLDDTPIEADKLGEILKDKVTANPDFKIALKADTKMTFGTLAKVMDAAHFAGLGDLQTFMDPAKSGAGGNGP